MHKSFSHRMLSLLSALLALTLSLGAAAPALAEASPRREGVYEVIEGLCNDAYEQYMNDGGERFDKLLSFHDALAASPALHFCAYGNNPAEVIERDIPDECLVNFGTEYASESRFEYEGEALTETEAIQVSEGYFDLFPIEIAEGRVFESADYDYSGAGVVPVILGSAYRPAFEIGDTFEAYYIFERFAFEVIGFAQPGGEFYLRAENRPADFDRYIVMPFPKIKADSAFGRRALLAEVSGFIAPDGTRDEAREICFGLMKDAGLEDWTKFFFINEQDLMSKLGASGH